jgi:hypothetical protein
LSEAKLKGGAFVGPDTRKLRFDDDFLFTMTEAEGEASIAFKVLLPSSWGKNKDLDHVSIVANMLEKFKVFGSLMSLKIYFLNSHLDFFPRKS